VGALAQCLDRLDPETARRMGEAARESIAHLTPEAMGREYLALYERLLAGKLG
jgi:glycosyltransferase involved in cell wall biosynthesis